MTLSLAWNGSRDTKRASTPIRARPAIRNKTLPPLRYAGNGLFCSCPVNLAMASLRVPSSRRLHGALELPFNVHREGSDRSYQCADLPLSSSVMMRYAVALYQTMTGDCEVERGRS